MHALVTGSSGFIGQHLVAGLRAQNWRVSTVSRQDSAPDADSFVDLKSAPLASVDVVYHLAGVAHEEVREQGSGDLTAVNVEGTLAAFRDCMAANVPRFVWLSSFKVLGEHAATPLTIDTLRAPRGDYAFSKAEGERVLLRELAAQGLDPGRLAIVRPPLVYGPGVKANFRQLLRWSQSAWPLPLAAARAGRAWLSTANLISFLALVAQADLHDRHIWHVCDDEQISVSEMLVLMATCGRKKPRLLSVPVSLLRLLAALVGQSGAANRLLNPLMMDASSSKLLLGWQPVEAQSEAIAEVVTWFRSQP